MNQRQGSRERPSPRKRKATRKRVNGPDGTTGGASLPPKHVHDAPQLRPDAPAVVLGGTGETPSVTDLNLLETAIKKEWPFRRGGRDATIARLLELVESPATPHNVVVAAAKCLVAADAVNAKREGAALAQQQDRKSIPAPATIQITQVRVEVPVGAHITPDGRVILPERKPVVTVDVPALPVPDGQAGADGRQTE
jgi:hypothetical protein